MPVRSVLVVHPSPDLYGSDRQLLESVEAMVSEKWRVVVSLPRSGPLVELLHERGAEVDIVEVPVLRKSMMRPAGLVRLALRIPVSIYRLRRLIRRAAPDVVYVNTLTIPTWVVASRLAGTPALCHVHEAEEQGSRLSRTSIALPLLFAQHIVVNSAAAGRALSDVLGRLAGRIQIIHNGIAVPADQSSPPRSRRPGDPAVVALVARLSPRKGIDVALEAVAELRAAGRHVGMIVCGTAFEGYEWYETQLRDRIARPDLAGHVELRGYVHPTWPVLGAADVVIVPSRAEPFGNTAVEAMLACRPIVASDVQGLAEVIEDGRTGLLVPPDDPTILALGIAHVLDDPDRALVLATSGEHEARSRFSCERYHADVAAAVRRLFSPHPAFEPRDTTSATRRPGTTR